MIKEAMKTESVWGSVDYSVIAPRFFTACGENEWDDLQTYVF